MSTGFSEAARISTAPPPATSTTSGMAPSSAICAARIRAIVGRRELHPDGAEDEVAREQAWVQPAVAAAEELCADIRESREEGAHVSWRVDVEVRRIVFRLAPEQVP